MRKRLLVLGGNRYNLPSLLSLRRAGFQLLVASNDPGAAGFELADVAVVCDVRFPDVLASKIEALGGVDGIVSMAEVGVRTATILSARWGLCSISVDAAERSTSKAAMRAAWGQLPRFSLPAHNVRDIPAAEAAAASMDRWPLIVKPDLSYGGSRGVSRVRDATELAEAVQFALDQGLAGTSVVLEPWVRGTEHSCEVLIEDGRTEVLCVGQKVKSAAPFRVDLSVQYPAPLPPEAYQQVDEMVAAAVGTLGLDRGVAHVEFVYTSDGPVLIELGARCGGSHTPQVVEAVTGVQEMVEYARLACGLPPDVKIGAVPLKDRIGGQKGADYRFLVFAPGTVESVEVPTWVREHKDVLDVEAMLAPGDVIGPLRTTSDRSGFVVTSGETLAAAVALADRACAAIVVKYDDGTTSSAVACGVSNDSSQGTGEWSTK